jgi:hypothetical protein
VFGGLAGGTNDVLADLPDLVENIIDLTALGAFVVVDGHSWSLFSLVSLLLRCAKTEKESS